MISEMGMTVWSMQNYCENVINKVITTKLEINKQHYIIIETGRMQQPFK